MYEFVSFFVAVFDSACLLLLFRFFAAPRYRWVGRYWGTAAIVLAIGLLDYFFLKLPMNLYVKALTSILLYAVYGLLFYKIRPLQAVFLSSLNYLLLSLCDYGFLLGLSWLFTGGDVNAVLLSEELFLIGFFGSRMLTFVACVLVGRFFANKALNAHMAYISNRHWALLLVYPCVTVYMLFTILTLSGLYQVTPLALSAVLLLLFSNLLLFFIVESIGHSGRQAINLSVMRQQYTDSLENSSMLLAISEQQRQLIHDFKHHSNAMRALLGAGQYDELHQYLQGQDVQAPSFYRFATGHPMVDAVLNQKDYAAQKLGVTLVVAAGDMQRTPLQGVHVVALLANVLDNAIEAAAQVRKGERTVRVTLSQNEREWAVGVINPVDRPVDINGGRMRTTKSDKARHGYGLHNVREIVEQYRGDCALRCEGGSFAFSCVIPTVNAP